jgi:transposase
LAFLNEGRRRAVDQRTQLANQIKSQLKVYFPLALLKSLLPYIARYEKQIAELFDAHPDSFLFRDLPGAGSALGPRLLTAYGTDRERFEHSTEISSLSGVAPVRRASGKKSGKKASVHFRHACPKVPTPKLS